MDLWDFMSYVAWVISGSVLLWMVVDMIKVSKEYDEDYLLSSREGEDILPEEKRDD